MKTIKNTNCYYCGNELTKDNFSNEHIILNSIGGHLESNHLLCVICNTKKMHDSDVELSNQFAYLSTFLNIKRDRGKVPLLKGGKNKDGAMFHLTPDGSPVRAVPEYKEYIQDGELRIYAKANSVKELATRIGGLKKRFNDFDIEEVKKQFRVVEEYYDEMLSYDTSVGGDLAFKSVLKSAINFFVYNRGSSGLIKESIQNLKEGNLANQVYHFHPKKSVYKKSKNEVVHLLHLVGAKHEKLVYCYVEFFSCYSFLVVLSDNYSGNSFQETYCYNLLLNKEVIKDVKLVLTKPDILEAFSNDKFQSILSKKLDRVMNIAMKRQHKKENSRVFHKICNEVYEENKPTKILTQKMINEISERYAEAYLRMNY